MDKKNKLQFPGSEWGCEGWELLIWGLMLTSARLPRIPQPKVDYKPKRKHIAHSGARSSISNVSAGIGVGLGTDDGNEYMRFHLAGLGHPLNGG